MAEGKKGFVLYCDQKHAIDLLPDETAGKLLKHIFSYVNDENPETDDLILKLAFEPIKRQLKRDLKKYNQTKRIKSEAGRMGNLKRWHPELYKDVVNEKKSLELAETIAKGRTESHSDVLGSHPIAKIAVIDTVIDTVSTNVDNSDYTINLKHMNTIIENQDVHATWIETCYRKYKLEKRKLGFALNNFNESLVMNDKVHKNLREYKRHFFNWMNTQESIGNLKSLKR